MSAALAAELKSFATRELGFDLVGVTRAEPLPGGEHLARWVRVGAHGDMTYLAETAGVRADPGRFLAGARSVVCVAMSYHEENEPPETGANRERAVVARYARRRDYHKVLRKRLVRLGRFVAERDAAAGWRPAVDTAPLLEKELAQRAGIGWVGKNTCLINRRLGSELLLGELVTSLPLPADEPETDHCGRCTACLVACPTVALGAPPPRFLDARRCISYATIEHRGAFPEAVRPGLGSHVFGCDICQAVCPWNERAPRSCNPALATREGLGTLTRTQLASLDDDAWAALSAGTPLRRIDAPRLRRNLAAITRAGQPDEVE